MKRTVDRWLLRIVPLGLLLFAGCGDSSFTTTDSGLRYKDLVVGTGATAKPDERVEIQYTGWLRDGKQFDSSKDRDLPFTLLLNGKDVIPGMDEGILGMKVGGVRKLVIPYKLAYGEYGRPPKVPPYADLTFDIELVGVYTMLPGGLYVQDLVIGQGRPRGRIGWKSSTPAGLPKAAPSSTPTRAKPPRSSSWRSAHPSRRESVEE